jgi:KUP system potassium uptake protein
VLCGSNSNILQDPELQRNPFFHLLPQWAVVPMVILATFATIIASQSSSLSVLIDPQAMQLGWSQA